MSRVAIRVAGLGKRYVVGERVRSWALRDIFANALKAPARPFGHSRNRSHSREHFWALRDVSFEVQEGEVVGLIGRNGAGKSTLLKILARVTRPTLGFADVQGRMGALLEVGTGFHGELTGRENVFLSGAVLGMSRREILRKFDEMVAFAEVEKFIDTPLKHYSTGMQMRLAFSVAAHLEPEILIVDEVLAVGDAAFQKKCLNRIGAASDAGRTVLLVSHNMTAIQRLCHRVFWIDNGNVVDSGSPGDVVSKYLNKASPSICDQEWPDPDSAPGNEKVKLRRARVRSLEGDPTAQITVRTPFVMEFEYWNLKPQARINLSLTLHTESGDLAFATAPVTESAWSDKPFPLGLFRSACYVPGDLLNDGVHRLTLLVVENGAHIVYRHEDLLNFEVQEDIASRKSWYGDWPGAVRPMLRWTTELVSEVAASERP